MPVSAPTLLTEGKAKCGFIEMARFHTVLRCRKELFMLYKDYLSTGGEPILSLPRAGKIFDINYKGESQMKNR